MDNEGDVEGGNHNAEASGDECGDGEASASKLRFQRAKFKTNCLFFVGRCVLSCQSRQYRGGQVLVPLVCHRSNKKEEIRHHQCRRDSEGSGKK